MAFIDTISASWVTGDAFAMYERQQRHYGYVPNYATVFCHRPEVMRRWGELLAAAELRGVARQLADNCEIEHSTRSRLDLVLSQDKAHLLTEQIRKRLEGELAAHLGVDLVVAVKLGEPPRKTPAQIRIENENQRMRVARESVEQDVNVQAMQSAFDAVVEADSVRPVED